MKQSLFRGANKSASKVKAKKATEKEDNYSELARASLPTSLHFTSLYILHFTLQGVQLLCLPHNSALNLRSIALHYTQRLPPHAAQYVEFVYCL